ncbi:delta 9-fatty acid desaturase protein [Coniophora puteana RWD-64-598 SS2]|uniref:Delta 9-fatty acid desaturase protein n=1 Tax=Coniophora puteana (strain RWD-64-598) TaxID=741705 RepID=A0A5M3N6U4_CONPW|nr:delta 9-fatty acid desaturase protein [Coniophora puteana RWD-64-598 SS2]EIW86998.1 delta 9-fatty acid desaturase protein [Coniophora puteana RWD-64-598 SS2]
MTSQLGALSFQPKTITATKEQRPPEIWWANAIFFVGVHVAALVGACYKPPSAVPRATLVLAFVMWQLAVFGITIGYHRLYSHRAFRASLGVRVLLAILGSSGFQGSIKWWCLRHRLHHVDDVEDDPYVFRAAINSRPSPVRCSRYAATRGLLYSHVGWIFYKPKYQRISLVDREDLDNDPVPCALFFGLICPTLLGYLWNDVLGAYIWGGLVVRIAAHWEGLQPYSDENTSRGNLILALLTGGEGNHNFVIENNGVYLGQQHAFPHDYRSGPSSIDWDPSKWIINSLYRLGLVRGLRRARHEDIKEAKLYMHHKIHHHGLFGQTDSEDGWDGTSWSLKDIDEYITKKPGSCIVIIDDFVVDASSYMGEHPGGAILLRNYSVKSAAKREGELTWKDATWAFRGGLNNHSRAAKRRIRELRIARFIQ